MAILERVEATAGEELSRLSDLLGPLRARPREAAILCDIDGTLAPIVSDPEDAAVPEAAREMLRELAERFLLVACVSGRRAADARRIVGVEQIAYAGNHGFELLEPGATEPVADPAVAGRSAAAAAFTASLDRDDLGRAGLTLEDKAAIQALHWRRAPDPEAARTLAMSISDSAQRAGLVPRWGRKVLELRPLSGIDKGSATTNLVRRSGARLAVFGGDDATDLDAFQALRWMLRSGHLDVAARIGVGSEEAPAGLAERTDIVVDGTEGFLVVLRYLAAEPAE
jgi:trehalose 6-phosphate phosphatase